MLLLRMRRPLFILISNIVFLASVITFFATFLFAMQISLARLALYTIIRLLSKLLKYANSFGGVGYYYYMVSGWTWNCSPVPAQIRGRGGRWLDMRTNEDTARRIGGLAPENFEIMQYYQSDKVDLCGVVVVGGGGSYAWSNPPGYTGLNC